MTETTALQDIVDDEGVQEQPISAVPLYLALFALALGGFAIGTTEFVTMGLLPQIADGVNISIPTAGHVVSAYALGVVIGAPTIAALAAKAPRKTVLVWLMVAFAIGNAASALAPSYLPLLAARFVSGLPHGAYFGIASIVAASLVPKAKRTWAVAMVLAGLTVANVLGVPGATLLGQRAGWQWPYALVAGIAALTVLAVLTWVPWQQPDEDSSIGAELRSLKKLQVWLALGIGVVGFGGMFATFSYIAPSVTEVTGISEGAIPLILVVYGVGMTVGASLAGRVAQRGIMRGIFMSLAAIAVLLGVFGFALHSVWTAVPAVFLLGLVPTLLVPMLQTRLMDVAEEGQSLAAALNHSTLNMANALGAWLGSVVLGAGYGYEWPSRVGALLAVAGLFIVGLSVLVGWRERERARL
ncbi:MFS transporter [Demetria terragena]|uniref:MFS transporter n=1 Tax=Demetria terragena TaxID=63959 RepID=UPI00036CA6C6|nr:MFS transporter [Demetria terragena]